MRADWIYVLWSIVVGNPHRCLFRFHSTDTCLQGHTSHLKGIPNSGVKNQQGPFTRRGKLPETTAPVLAPEIGLIAAQLWHILSARMTEVPDYCRFLWGELAIDHHP